MVRLMLENIEVKPNLLTDDKYKFLFSVEEVNRLVIGGMPFRDAYKKVGLDIERGDYDPEKTVKHTHEGSIGNLCLPEIRKMMQRVLADFNFGKSRNALDKLING